MQTEPKLTVQQLLEKESWKDYIKTPLQTLDGIYVASRSTPGVLGGPYCEIITSNYDHFGYFSRLWALDAPHQKCITKLVDVTSFDDAMTSYVMSLHCMCICHVTIYYKRP